MHCGWATWRREWIGNQAFDSCPEATLHTTHGNQKFYLSLGMDALTGNSDSYHCVLRISPL